MPTDVALPGHMSVWWPRLELSYASFLPKLELLRLTEGPLVPSLCPGKSPTLLNTTHLVLEASCRESTVKVVTGTSRI